MWTQEMFGVEKPIIALLHLDALPGDPGARYAELLAGRLAVYSGIATQTVDASALPADVAAMIISGLPQAS